MKNLIYYILLLYAAVCAFSITAFNGTGDAGDSIAHYLFAKYAPVHPELYFDHWAKPLFVLIASPFAQFGIPGIKVFNSLVTLATIYFTYRIALAMNCKNALLIPVFMFFAPLYYILTFSGLTEPLFALFIAVALYLCILNRYMAACILVSFLPYVRSEGLIIIGVFTIYLMYKKLWQFILWLFAGSLVYAIAGYFVHHDLLWVFKRIPYASLSSVYGSGRLLHFVEEYVNVIGVPLYGLFWLGFVVLFYALLRKKIHAELSIFVWFGFCSFFVAHTLFWYFGIFNSMGLKRVLLGIMPLIAVIILCGFNFLTEETFKLSLRGKRILQGLIIAYVLVFPFTINPSAIQWNRDMFLQRDQLLVHQVAKRIRSENKCRFPLLYSHHYFSVVLDADFFDYNTTRSVCRENLEKMRSGEVLVWDNIYAEKNSDVKKSELDTLSVLRHLFTSKSQPPGREFIFAVYERK